MAWIESHLSLGQHPKLLRLAKKLGISDAQAVGHLHYIWWWALEYSPSGDISKLATDELAIAAHWQGDSVDFSAALELCNWVDNSGHLHDWQHYAGNWLLGRERQKRYREKRLTQRNGDVINDVSATVAVTATIPNLTIPNHTLPITKEATKSPRPSKSFVKPTAEEVTNYGRQVGFVVDGQHFCDFYESKGWVVGRSPMKSWQATVRTWKKRGGQGLGQNKFNPGIAGTKVGATGGFVPTKQSII